MTRYLSSLVLVCFCLAGCATPSGAPAQAVARPAIAAAYLPLSGQRFLGLEQFAGAAVVVAPGVAATCAHNADLVDPAAVLGTATLSDLMFFRTQAGPPPAMAAPKKGAGVIAYGQSIGGQLRVARGRVRQIVITPGYARSPYFIFAGNAGPGFSGGPVVNEGGKLIGITFGYRDSHGQRLIYAYGMDRVMAELAGLEKAKKIQ